MTTEHLICGRVDLQVGDQRLGKSLDREFRSGIGGVRDAWPD